MAFAALGTVRQQEITSAGIGVKQVALDAGQARLYGQAARGRVRRRLVRDHRKRDRSPEHDHRQHGDADDDEALRPKTERRPPQRSEAEFRSHAARQVLGKKIVKIVPRPIVLST